MNPTQISIKPAPLAQVREGLETHEGTFAESSIAETNGFESDFKVG